MQNEMISGMVAGKVRKIMSKMAIILYLNVSLTSRLNLLSVTIRRWVSNGQPHATLLIYIHVHYLFTFFDLSRTELQHLVLVPQLHV